MRIVLFFSKKIIVALLAGVCLPTLISAQTGDSPLDRFEQLKRRMDEQMRRIMPPADSTFSKGGQLHVSPDSSSFFYFHVDTTLDGSSSQFFDFRSFGLPQGEGPSGLDQMFERFFRGMDPFDNRLENRGDSGPRDDGNAPPADDELLPEERLRQKEGQSPAAPAAPKSKESSRVKTIRI